jgi:hypothetical protein
MAVGLVDARGKVNYLQDILRVPIVLHEALINLVNKPLSAGIDEL